MWTSPSDGLTHLVLGCRLCPACGAGLLLRWGSARGMCANPACGIGWGGMVARVYSRLGPRVDSVRAYRREWAPLEGRLFHHLPEDVDALWVWRRVTPAGRLPPTDWRPPREHPWPWRRRNRHALRQLRARRKALKRQALENQSPG